MRQGYGRIKDKGSAIRERKRCVNVKGTNRDKENTLGTNEMFARRVARVEKRHTSPCKLALLVSGPLPATDALDHHPPLPPRYRHTSRILPRFVLSSRQIAKAKMVFRGFHGHFSSTDDAKALFSFPKNHDNTDCTTWSLPLRSGQV
ncbi:hypothetical protein E2C01_008714 [Portunus trituberculatus]|uniref:Uncharacterized protein n=1 Tax=Portunus trituberculatus TaxID=210409 RepID=A0A5B7D2K1_PORTR|nr:hypothetical protein [Portunus trituberculatus]